MAHIVSVYDQDKYDFQPLQVPIEVDNIKMVVQFSNKCIDCGKTCRLRQKDLEHFTSKFNTLTKDEVAVALLVSGKDLLSMLPLTVPCVGCRKSVERLFYQLQKSQHRALEPLVITPRGELSIQHEYLFDPRSLFSLFHVHGPKLHSVVEAVLKSKKNKRCNLHSLETHKTRTLGCWLDAWDALSESCREKVLLLDMNELMTTIDSYLDKHKFCADCKSKVMLAYSILIGQHDSSSEEGYCAALFENLRCCASDQHIHVLNDTDFIADLLEKAEPEFLGGKRDRHAKTLDIAQEEILTCFGIHIFERLHRIWQKLRCEEQTWLILLYMGVDALRKSYQVALEKKQGASDLELLCEELQEKEKRQGVKREIKRQKKKQKKSKMSSNKVNISSTGVLGMEISCLCSSMEADNSLKSNNHHHQHCGHSCSDANFNSVTLSLQGCDLCFQGLHDSPGHDPGVRTGAGNRWFGAADVGSCDNCSKLDYNEGSQGESTSSCSDSIGGCQCDMLRTPPKRFRSQQIHFSPSFHNHKNAFQSNEQPLLQDLLDELCWVDGEDDDPVISEEEILAFKAREVEVENTRQKLRENLRQRFQDLYLSRHVDTV